MRRGMIYNGFSAKARPKAPRSNTPIPRKARWSGWTTFVLLKDAPNRENALKFMNFLLDPENAAAVTNYAAYHGRREGVEPFLAEAIKTSPENNPPETQKFEFVAPAIRRRRSSTDAIWTNLKK